MTPTPARPTIGSPLTAADLALHHALGIDADTLARAQVRRVDDREARDVLALNGRPGDLNGVLYPYRWPGSSRPLTHRLRRDHPEVENGQPKNKYLSAYGDRRHLYLACDDPAWLADTSISIIAVEAEKSVLAITCAAARLGRRVLAIGLGGCWGWKGRIGKVETPNGGRSDEMGPIADLDRIVWTGRDTIIAFDANAATNPKVQAARNAFAAELTTRGATVRMLALPVEPGVNGPDDFIGRHGDAAFVARVDQATAYRAKSAKAKPEKPKQGRDVQFEEVEPWPEPVDGAALLDAIAETCSRYLALPPYASVAVALWVLHTHTFEAWFATPFLAITSPEKRCGKTLLLIVLGACVPRRLFASNVTPAVLFRAIEKYRPTLLIDEADTFVRDNEELRGVLNSGHTRTTATVIRAVGDDHDPRAFSTWCPKAIALIGRLPGTLDDRSIEIRMRRRTAGERVARLRQDRIDGECESFRRQALRWADDQLDQLKAADPEVPPALHDRAADCWRPLLAIADAAGGDWPARAREAALALSGTPDEEAASTRLLRDIKDVFTEADDPEVLGSSTIVEKLVAIEDAPWAEWSKGKPLSPAKLARLLAGYSIYPAGTVRIGPTKTAKGYRRAAFAEAWQRYLGGLEPSQRNNPNESGPESPFSNRHNQNECDGLKSVTNPMNTERCYVVTVRDPPETPVEQKGNGYGRIVA